MGPLDYVTKHCINDSLYNYHIEFAKFEKYVGFRRAKAMYVPGF